MIKTVIVSIFAVMCTAGIVGTATARQLSPGLPITAEAAYYTPAALTGAAVPAPRMPGAAEKMSRDADNAPAINSTASPDRHTEGQRVLEVLRPRIGDPRLLDRVGQKLSSMSDRRLRLAVTLSDRIAGGVPAAETDIAFLLLTTLIIFS